MAGYNGYSMSNNAVEAYEEGRMPLSKWTKSAILIGIENAGYDSDFFKKWTLPELKNALLICGEWHHTGADFKKTKFYRVDTDAVEEYLAGKEKPAISANTPKKETPAEEAGTWSGEYKCTEYHPTSRYNRYKVWYEPFSGATKKGDWFTLRDGSRKKASNCINVKQDM